MFPRQRSLTFFASIVCGLLFFGYFSFENSYESLKILNSFKVGKSIDEFESRGLVTLQFLNKVDLSWYQFKGHFDVSGKYKILPYVQTAQEWDQLSKRSLCVAVQASLDHADKIVALTSNWPGTVSLAILAPGQEFSLALQFISYLRRCFSTVDRQVSVHLVYPVNHPPEFEEYLENWAGQQDCDKDLKTVLNELLELRSNDTVKWRNDLLYPQNVLRNVAREHCHTEWVTCPDIDMLFPEPTSENLIGKLENFLQSESTVQCEKCAYVLPIYEIDHSCSKIPNSKEQLLEFIREKKARQYHVKVFSPNQGLSKLSKWESIKSFEQVRVAYTIPKFKFWYEPIYIARRGVPRFDERYLGFGMVRNTQTYEMSLAGYNFQILDNIFLSHWGFQTARTHSPARTKQTNHNRNLFYDTYLRELTVRYDADPEKLLKRFKSKKKHNIKLSLVEEDQSTKSQVEG